MPDNILSTISRLREARRKRDAQQERFSIVADAYTKSLLHPRPQPEEPEYMVDRKLLVSYLPDEVLRESLGLGPAYFAHPGLPPASKPFADLASVRNDPDRYLQPEQLARLDRMGVELGMQEPVGDDWGAWEFFRRPLSALMESGAFVGQGQGLLGANSPVRRPMHNFLFGDTGVLDPTITPRGPVTHGMLRNPQDRADWLRRVGVAGALGQVWQSFVTEPAAAFGAGSLASFHALLGGSDELAERIASRMDAGEVPIIAMRNAYLETDLPPGARATAEVVFDPANWFMLGLAGRGFVGAGKAATVFGRAAKTAAIEASESDLVRNKAIRTLLRLDKVPLELKHVSKRNVEAARSLFATLDEPSVIADDWAVGARLINEPTTVADEMNRVGRQTWLRQHPGTMESPSLAAEVVSQPVKWLDPSVIEKNPAKQLFQAQRATRAAWDDTKRVGSDLIRLLQPQMQIDSTGFVRSGMTVRRGLRKTLGYTKTLHISDFLETKPEDLDKVYGGLTDANRLFHATVRRLFDDLYEIKKKYGLLSSEELAEGVVYYPRLPKDPSAYRQLMAESMKFDVGLGTKQRFEFGRQFGHVADDLRQGFKLADNPALVWELHVNHVARAVVERQLAQVFKDKGLILSDEAVGSALKGTIKLRNAVERVIGGKGRALESLREIDDPELHRILALSGEQLIPSLKGYADVLRVDIGLLSDSVRLAKTGGVRLHKGGPLLSGQTAVDEAIAETILRGLRSQTTRTAAQERFGPVRFARDAADFVRTTSTNLDFSAPWIQGLPLLFMHPELWAEATARHFEAFFIPTARARFTAENIGTIQEMVQKGVQFGTSEFTAAMKQRFLAGTWKAGERSIFKPIEGASKVTSAVLTPFARAFDTFGDVARVQLWKATRHMAKNDKELGDLADFVNHMTGAFNSAKLGISTGQQALESFSLFSPRYARAGLALTKDLFQGGFRSKMMVAYQSNPGPWSTPADVAKRIAGIRPGAFAYFVLQAPMYYYVATRALGQEAKLDPRPVSRGGDGAEFMTFEVGKARVGPGSWWLTFVRLLGAVYADALQNPDGFASWESVKDVSYDLYRFARGKLGPGAATIEDLRTGNTFIGERIDGSNFANYVLKATTMEAGRAMPFLLQDFIEGPPDTTTIDRLSRIPPSALGLRVFAESTFGRRDVQEASLVTAQFGEGVTPDDIRAGKLDGPIEQQGVYALNQLFQGDLEWRRLTEMLEADRARRGSDAEILLQDFFTETERIENDYDTAKNALHKQFRDINSPLYGEGRALIDALSRIGQDVSTRFDTLRAAPRFKEMLADLDERKQKDIKKRMEDGEIFAGDVAYEMYKTDVLGKDDVPVAVGGFRLPNYEPDWDARDAALRGIAETTSQLDPRYTPDEILHYVELRRGARTPDQVPLHPGVADLEHARDVLKPYWEIPKTLYGSEPDWPTIKAFLTADDLQAEERLRAAIDKDAPRRFRRGRWEGRSDVIKQVVKAEKEQWRKQNPEGDALLADYYGGTPTTTPALEMYLQRRRAGA